MFRIKEKFNNFFYFNNKERRGIAVLMLIIFLVLAFNIYLPDIFSNDTDIDFSSYEKEIREFEEEQIIKERKSQYKKYKKKDYSKKSYNNYKKNNRKLTPFPFNPNNLPKEEWRKIGLSDRQVSVIKNYESKGGKFYKKEDLKKIYCISDADYLTLEPFIKIENLKYEKKTYQEKEADLMLDLNTSNVEDLQKLKGIGPSFSKRIIKYRDLLGGYYKKEQLLEVYGFEQEKFDNIQQNITINPSRIKKININSATIDDLKTHPYIKYSIARLIVNYRKQHGDYDSVESIKSIKTISDDLFEKIKFYLTV